MIGGIHMSKKILEFTRTVYEMMQKDLSLTDVMDNICAITANDLDTNVMLLDKDGLLLAEKHSDSQGFIFTMHEKEAGQYIDSQLNDQFRNIVEVKENIKLNDFYIKKVSAKELKQYVASIFPVSMTSSRVGTLVLYRAGENYDLEGVCIADVVNIIIALIISNLKSQIDVEQSRKIGVVRSAIGTLSYSELDAIVHIFDELGGREGILVASKIADNVGITRSVIVNALRKFESAGVIETRSLGMKGTFIKVMNDNLLTELNKLRG